MAFLPVKNAFHSIGFMHLQGPNGDGRRNPCADFELNAAECLEAYGVRNGVPKCQAFLEDLMECKLGLTSRMRLQLMQLEKYKKVARGEIPFSERRGVKSPLDSYMNGAFYP